ncbi:beta propeller repeat protein [Flindersiella endophytica]
MRYRLALGFVLVVLLAAPAAAVQPSWSVVPSPNQNPAENRLLDVTAVASSDAWAAGFGIPANQSDQVSILLHWNGQQWSLTDHPRPVANNRLNAVDALTGNDVWAVGSAGGFPFTTHWNGARWTTAASPRPGIASSLSGVRTFSGNRAWAVGGTNLGNFDGSLLTMRWNGTSWTEIPTPAPIADISNLYDVDGVSPDNVWAVGLQLDSVFPIGSYHPVVLHWTGQAWTLEQLPAIAPSARLEGVVALAANDVWAVGSKASSAGGPWAPLLLHWDGAGWQQAAAPVTAGELRGVTATSPQSVDAVGFSGINNRQALALHWDGTTWTSAPVPTLPGNVELEGTDAAGPDALWAVGNQQTTTRATLTLRGSP